jgi:hypothetical protein
MNLIAALLAILVLKPIRAVHYAQGKLREVLAAE